MASDTRYMTHDEWSILTQVTYPNGRQVASGDAALYRRNSVTEPSGDSSIAAWDYSGTARPRWDAGTASRARS